MVVLDDDDPRSVSRGAYQSRKLSRALGARRHTRGVVCARLQKHRGRPRRERTREATRRDPLGVEFYGDRLRPQVLDEVEEVREAGVFDHHAVSEAHDLFERTTDAVQGTVDDSDRLRIARPHPAEQRLQFG